jgi:putative FmdB family regulatory protein
MPTYVYECGKCGDEVEIWQSFQDEPLKRHAGGCGGKLTKVLQPVGILLKGPGFYKTDSRDATKRNGKSTGDRSESGGSGEVKESKASEKSGSSDTKNTKSESKKDSTKASTKAPSST